MLTLLFLAQAAPEPDGLEALAVSIFQAIRSGQLSLTSAVAVVALMVVVWLLRKVLAPKFPFFATKLGALVLNIVASGLAAAVTAIMAGTSFTWALLGASLLMSYYAAGGHGIWKTVWEQAEPYVWPLVSKVLPSWLLGFISRGNVAVIEAKINKAGLAAAVTARAPASDAVANGP